MAYVRKQDAVGTSTTLDIGSAGSGRLVTVWLTRAVTLGGTQQWSVTVDGKACTIRKVVNHVDGSDGAHGELYSIDEAGLTTSNGTVTIAVGSGDASMHICAMLHASAGAASHTFGDSGSATDTNNSIAVTGIDSAAGDVVICGVSISGSGGWSWEETAITSPLVVRATEESTFQSMMAEGTEASGASNKTYTVDFEGGAFYTVAAVAVFTPVSGTTLVVADATHAHAVDNVVLDVGNSLTVAEATHGHSAENVVLSVPSTWTYVRTAVGSGPTISLNVGTPGTGRLVGIKVSTEGSLGSGFAGTVTVDGKTCVQGKTSDHDLEAAPEGSHTELHYIREAQLGASAGTVDVSYSGSGSWHIAAVLYTGGSGTVTVFDSEDEALTGSSITIAASSQANSLVMVGAVTTIEGGFEWAAPTSPLVTRATRDASGFQSIFQTGVETSAQSEKSYTVDVAGGDGFMAAVALTFVGSAVGSLEVQEATHGHLVDSPSLSTGDALVIDEAFHAHSVDQIDLSGAGTLAVADATQAHTVDNIALGLPYALAAVQDATHAHHVDSVAFSLENPFLSVNGITVPLIQTGGAIVRHLPLGPPLRSYNGTIRSGNLAARVKTRVWPFSVPELNRPEAAAILAELRKSGPQALAGFLTGNNEAGHVLSIQSRPDDELEGETVSFELASSLAVAAPFVQDSVHAHEVDNIVLQTSEQLLVADATHAHFADNVALSIAGPSTLAPADATHSHFADNIILSGTGGGGGFNEPSGYVFLTDNPMEGATIAVNNFGHSAGVGLTNIDGRRAAVFTYPTGKQDGTGAGRIWRDYVSPFPVGLYFRYDVKRSSNWTPHPVLDKAGYMHGTGHAGGGDPLFWGFGDGPHGLGRSFWVYRQGPMGNTNFSANQTNVDCQIGSWTTAEIQLIAGSGSGQLHCWVNGTKTHQYTGINWGCSSWDFLNIDPIWGGNMGIFVPETMYQYHDNYYLSRAP